MGGGRRGTKTIGMYLMRRGTNMNLGYEVEVVISWLFGAFGELG